MSELIVEGRLINFDEELYSQVKIDRKSGLIEKVGDDLGKPDIKAGEEELIFSGFLDIHVHAREDISGKQNYKEDFRTVSEAAIHGGVVCIADMPNNPLPPINEESYKAKLNLTSKSLIPVLLYVGIGPETKPFGNVGDHPYKVFMGPSVGELYFESDSQLKDVISRYKGENVSFHCEDPKILEENKNASTHELRRPPEAEIEAINLALDLIDEYELKGKICHVSTKKGLNKIIKAKKKGIAVEAEVTPHHLYFDESMLNESNRLSLQMNPPIRKKKDREYLLDNLKKGNIDYFATDHAPHTIEEKKRGISGVPNLDTYGLFTTWLMEEKKFKPEDIARVCCYNPGKFVNEFLDHKYGKIEEGYVGSLTIIDITSPKKITSADLKTKCGWSPFEGIEFPGSVKYTIVKGKVYSF